MPPKHIPCRRCGTDTPQISLIIQLFGGERRWRKMFYLCTSCFQQYLSDEKREFLNQVDEDMYTATPDATASTQLEKLVLSFCQSERLPNEVQNFLLRNGIRLNDHEVKELLDRMSASRKLKRSSVDLTEQLKGVLEGTRLPKRCEKCGGKAVSIYGQMRDVNGSEIAVSVISRDKVLKQTYFGQDVFVKQSHFERRRAKLQSYRDKGSSKAGLKLKELSGRQRNYVRTRMWQIAKSSASPKASTPTSRWKGSGISGSAGENGARGAERK